MSYKFYKILENLILLILLITQVDCLFKLTNLKCESFNRSLIVFNECRLRPLKRDVIIMNVNASLFVPITELVLKLKTVKKANGYKPFLYNCEINACDYLKHKNHPLINLIFKQMSKFSNINHTCPLMGEQIIKGMSLNVDIFPLPLPAGDYGLLTDWYVFGKKTFSINIYFVFQAIDEN